jgi:hypothetical protein
MFLALFLNVYIAVVQNDVMGGEVAPYTAGFITTLLAFRFWRQRRMGEEDARGSD